VAYLQIADFDAARAEFEKAIKLSPQDATLHYDLGLALKLKDKLPEAMVEFRKAAELDPGQADAHYTLGVTLWQQGDFTAAAVELRAAIRAKPDYAEAYYTLGTVLKQAGELPEAANALREAIRMQPDFAGAHTTLAAVLRQLGDDEGAAAESRAGAEIAKQKTSEQAALFATNSGRRLLHAGDLEGAISQFRAAINSSPNYAAAHFELGVALRQQGKFKEAQEEFQKAAKLDSRLTAPTSEKD
jgi:tetratricopeptide (TPR) repeat protein